ncbi:uncharacterized protein LOC114351434 [Ostrinia furnacalis]|uniref:uncharacterized protein LOC114351434 n=1 Tax=Ostrinia furnacalis TaxID=93504 RepID=UPI001038681E|nr:uncharacterized protein LOC114351434 [Ostrinia furnacalis]
MNAELDAAMSVANGTSKATIEEVESECSAAHVPYSPGAGPYRAELSTCGGCRRARVPAVLLSTCSKPSRLASYSKAVTLTAVETARGLARRGLHTRMQVFTARGLARRGLHTRMQVFTDALTPKRDAPPYAFVQAWRGKVQGGGLTVGGVRGAGERQVGRALDALAYKLRRLQPAALLTAAFRIDLPEDEIQLVVSGTAVRLADAREPERRLGTGDADDDIFALDEEQLARAPVEPVDEKMANGQTPTTVSLTSVCTISGARAVRRVCALRLLFVRETTTVRELGGLSGFLHTFTCESIGYFTSDSTPLIPEQTTQFARSTHKIRAIVAPEVATMATSGDKPFEGGEKPC